MAGSSPIRAAEFDEIYKRHAGRVFLRARRLVAEDADDVVQEVFARLLKQPPRDVDPEGATLRAWLTATTNNACVDLMRRTARRDAGWWDAVKHALAKRQAPGLQLEDRIALKDLLRQALVESDEPVRRVAIAVWFDELTQEDAAQRLGLTRKTVAKYMKIFTKLLESIGHRR